MSTFISRAAVLVTALVPLAGFAAPLSLEAALELAVQRSEAARAARAGLASATEASRAAGQLADPTLRVGIENLPVTRNDRFSVTRDSMTMKRIGISQEWLSRDKREARRAAADAAASREAVQVWVAAAEARLQTALAYVDAFYANEVLRLTTLLEHHAQEQVETARARLASATGSSQEVLLLAGARGAAEDESAEVRQQESVAQVALYRWAGTQSRELAPIPTLAIPTEEDFVAGDPAVAALQRDIEVARKAAAVAAADRKPNWTWEVAYGQRSGYSDMVTVGVSIPLTVLPGERQDRDTAAKMALVDKAEADLAEASRAAAAEYRLLKSDARRLQERIDRYRAGVVTPAQQRIAVTVAAYRSNQGSLVTVFEARHAEVEQQRKLLVLQRDLARRQVQLAYRTVATEAAR